MLSTLVNCKDVNSFIHSTEHPSVWRMGLYINNSSSLLFNIIQYSSLFYKSIIFCRECFHFNMKVNQYYPNDMSVCSASSFIGEEIHDLMPFLFTFSHRIILETFLNVSTYLGQLVLLQHLKDCQFQAQYHSLQVCIGVFIMWNMYNL